VWNRLRAGLIAGASDDDPSGIATYSQAGAIWGFQLAWTLLFSYPLMVAIQAISARIGRTTGHGIAASLREYYPNSSLQIVVALLCTANTLNLGADLGAMAECLRLLVPEVPGWAWISLLALSCGLSQALCAYERYVPY